MTNRSKSTLFLIEQLIVIAVFAICAVACISILAAAFSTANDTRAINRAILNAESGAEAFKATGGDLEAVAEILGGTVGAGDAGPAYLSDVVVVFYDDSWRICDAPDASYILTLGAKVTPHSNGLILSMGRVIVGRVSGESFIEGQQLVALDVAARTR